MKILITGADGFLGGKITRRLLNETDYDVISVSFNEELVANMIEREGVDKTRVSYLSHEDFLDPQKKLKDVAGAVHLAFARRLRPANEIASSLDFAAAAFHKLADSGVDHIINMSSQGVYGAAEEIRTELTAPAPGNHYTMAKYASEILFNDILRDAPHHTNFRLDLVAQSQNIIIGLCRSAKEGQINLKGGKQVFSFIDGEDAARAVVAMLKTDGGWDPVYNVGWNRKRYSLTELAELVADAAETCGYKRPPIVLEEADIALWAGMDSSRFTQKTGWEPAVELSETLCQLLRS